MVERRVDIAKVTGSNPVDPTNTGLVACCLKCGNPLVTQRNGAFKFCSNSCQQAFRLDQFEREWVAGVNTGLTSGGQVSSFIYTLLFKRQDGACAMCELKEWMGSQIPLELDHADGNSFNCSPGNVRLICCNCHSTTPTYKGRNRGKGRLSRAVKFLEGTHGTL